MMYPYFKDYDRVRGIVLHKIVEHDFKMQRKTAQVKITQAPKKFVVVTLKFEQGCFTIKYLS